MAPAAEEWFILYGVPKVVAMEETIFQESTNVSFTFNKAPLPSHVTVADDALIRSGFFNYPYIAAAARCGILLLCGHSKIGFTYYLCDPLIRRTLGIVPPDGDDLSCRYSVGLISDRSDTHLMVAELNPSSLAEHGRVTLRCTVDMCSWVEKESAECSDIVERREWHGDGVLTHKFFLWWFDLSYCILACDPFADKPRFHQIMFPSVPDAMPFYPNPIYGDVHRCLKVSNGRLRYVQIHGTSVEKMEVSMWTLSSSDPADAKWTNRVDVPFEKIWDDPSYRSKGLPPQVVPAVALVHPMRASEVYFCLATHIFSVNLKEKKTVDCEEFSIRVLPHKICSSRLLHAWRLPVGYTKQSGPGLSRVMECQFVNRWSSVEDFHTKAEMIIRSRPKPHDDWGM
ncbi:hypothetical protein ACQ4PT_040069 [Festuca glaucescens]